MSSIIRALSLLALLSPPPAGAAAQTIPATVKPGLKVAVVDEVGGSVEGRVQEISERFVRLAARGGIRDIPVERIVRIEQPDTVKNGALVGFGIGAGMGLIAEAVEPMGVGIFVWRTLGNGVVCAGLGALIDGAMDRRRTLYERGARPQARLRPVIGRHMRGVSASIEW